MNFLKRILCMLLVVFMMFPLVACSSLDEEDDDDDRRSSASDDSDDNKFGIEIGNKENGNEDDDGDDNDDDNDDEHVKIEFETIPDGAYLQNKTAIVSYNIHGYGDSWLRKCAEEFNKMYAAEGYNIQLNISYSNENNALLEIGKGAAMNDVDLYLGASNLERLLEASDRVMRGQGACLVDLTDVVWNTPAIGLDKREESQTIAERFLLDEEYLYYDGNKSEFHGGIFCLPLGMSSCGIVLNPSVTEKYGYGLENLPKTTDEFNAMCDKIAETSASTGVYAYAWPGGNASGYITYLFFEYFAQYSGKEGFMNFVKTVPFEGATVQDIKRDGWKVYEDKGILEGFKAMEPIMKPKYSPADSVYMTHLEAQCEVLDGNAAFVINGDWVLNEMEKQYYNEASQCIMMNTPILSVIGTECGITDAELSKAVGMIDEGKTNAQIIAAIPGLDNTETQRIRDARNIWGRGESAIRTGCAIPAYSDAKDVAVLFLRFLCSEDAAQIIRDEAYMLTAYSCQSYASKGNTRYMDSVVANINPGYGESISMDASLSIVRANSGMLYFNHPMLIQPVTFKNMIMDTSGEMTAEKMYENEKAFAKSQWSIWAAYVK